MKHDQGTPFSPSPLLFQTLPRSSKGFQTIRGQFNEDNFQIICNMKDYYKVKLSSMDNNNRSRIIWVKMFLAIADGHYCLKAQKMHNCCRLLPQLYYIELQRSLAAVEKMWSVITVNFAVFTFVWICVYCAMSVAFEHAAASRLWLCMRALRERFCSYVCSFVRSGSEYPDARLVGCNS